MKIGNASRREALDLVTSRGEHNEGTAYRIGSIVAGFSCYAGVRSGWPLARQRLASPPPFWCYGRCRPLVCAQQLRCEGHEDSSEWQNDNPSRSQLRLSCRSASDGERAPRFRGLFYFATDADWSAGAKEALVRHRS